MSLQPNEVLIIVLVALIVLGPKRLPGAIRGIGRAMRQVRDFSASVREEMDATVSAPIMEPPAPPAKPRPAADAESESVEGTSVSDSTDAPKGTEPAEGSSSDGLT